MKAAMWPPGRWDGGETRSLAGEWVGYVWPPGVPAEQVRAPGLAPFVRVPTWVVVVIEVIWCHAPSGVVFQRDGFGLISPHLPSVIGCLGADRLAAVYALGGHTALQALVATAMPVTQPHDCPGQHP